MKCSLTQEDGSIHFWVCTVGISADHRLADVSVRTRASDGDLYFFKSNQSSRVNGLTKEQKVLRNMEQRLCSCPDRH